MNKDKILVCHKDDNPLNNRLDNLFLGTPMQNSTDMVNKNRAQKCFEKRIQCTERHEANTIFQKKYSSIHLVVNL